MNFRKYLQLLLLVGVFLPAMANAMPTKRAADEKRPVTPAERPVLHPKQVTIPETPDKSRYVKLLAESCPGLFDDAELEEVIDHYYQEGPGLLIPYPGNIDQHKLKKSSHIAALITAHTPPSDDRGRLIQRRACLNHFAYALSRGIPKYAFYNPGSWKNEIGDTFPHWVKVISLLELLPTIEYNQWVLWIDMDVLISDFDPTEDPLPDRIINHYLDTFDGTNQPSLLVTEDPFSKINTGVFLIRHTSEAIQLLKDWWDCRFDDMHPSTKEKDNPRFFCLLTGKKYTHQSDCLEACGSKTAIDDDHCRLSTRDGDSEWYSKEWHPMPHHDQTALMKMIYSQWDLSEYDRHIHSPHSEAYSHSHIVKIIPALAPIGGKTAGFNTFNINREVPEKGRAINPRRDKFVHFPGMGDTDIEFYQYRWLTHLRNDYPVINTIKGCGGSWDIYPCPTCECQKVEPPPPPVRLAYYPCNCPDCPKCSEHPKPPECPTCQEKECPTCKDCPESKVVPDRNRLLSRWGLKAATTVGLLLTGFIVRGLLVGKKFDVFGRPISF